jgi:hypothetical protein
VVSLATVRKECEMKRTLHRYLGLAAIVPLTLGIVACEPGEAPVDPVFEEPLDDGFDDGADGF